MNISFSSLCLLLLISQISCQPSSWLSSILESWRNGYSRPSRPSGTSIRPSPICPISNNDLAAIARTDGSQERDFNATLASILIPRVPGTPSHLQVNEYIKTSFQKLDWIVEEDSFIGKTPLGNMPFRNIIATLNPKACKRLVLACHYDSKLILSRGRWFLGATDSAVPCSMMIQMVRSLDGPLKRHAKANPSGTTLQMIFFDGEEAFQNWSDDDSLYGSRHLANKWMNRNSTHASCSGTELNKIELFVLLDLLGAKNPKFASYFQNTHQLYLRMYQIEKQLNLQGLMRPSSDSSDREETHFFSEKRSYSLIEDDHIPFLRKGVPILHIIAYPFPSVWHKMTDDKTALDHPTIWNLISIFQGFLVEYLGLEL